MGMTRRAATASSGNAGGGKTEYLGYEFAGSSNDTPPAIMNWVQQAYRAALQQARARGIQPRPYGRSTGKAATGFLFLEGRPNGRCLLGRQCSVECLSCHAQVGERHAHPPHDGDYRDCHARQPARLWASKNERKAVRAGCGRWRSQLDPIDAAGRRSAGRHAQ